MRRDIHVDNQGTHTYTHKFGIKMLVCVCFKEVPAFMPLVDSESSFVLAAVLRLHHDVLLTFINHQFILLLLFVFSKFIKQWQPFHCTTLSMHVGANI